MKARKPSYLGLLNAIVLGERDRHAVLTAWCARTTDASLAATLRFVAVREREHAAAFTKRLSELGFGVLERRRAGHAKRLALAASDACDRHKFEVLLTPDVRPDGRRDPLSRLLDDVTIDPQTATLLGRFICEERDSDRRLRREYQRIRLQDERPTGLPAVSARLRQLTRTLDELKAMHEAP